MLERLVRYIRGYLMIHVTGSFAERFLNGCSHHKIRLWNLKPVPGGYEMNITISGFRKLKPIIRKTGIKVVIIKRSGLPFLLFRYRKRRLFLSGIFLCILLVLLLSRHVWSIEFVGNQTYTDDTLLKFLSAIDVSSGMPKSRVDCAKIAADIRKEYQDIVWVSASVEGTKLKIRLKENEDYYKEETKTEDPPTDIVADLDGTITQIVPREGVVLAEEGMEVRKGDILVSGQVPVLNDQKEVVDYQYRNADAKITAETELNYQDEIDLFYEKKDYDMVKKTESFFQIGPWRLTVGSIKNSYEHWTMEGKETEVSDKIHINLPVSYGYRIARPYHASKKRYSNEKLQEILSARFWRYKKDLEKKGVEIIENDVKIYTESDKAAAGGRLKILTPVGITQASVPLEVPAQEEEKQAGD